MTTLKESMATLLILSDAENNQSRIKSPAVGRFSERGLQESVLRLVDLCEYDGAVRQIVENLPGLYSSRLNAREKLNNLQFLARTIQLAGGAKYGYSKLRSKFGNINKTIRGLELADTGGFVELGCGAHDPIALSTYFYLNGYSPNYAIDMLPPRTALFSAMSMYDIIANVRMFPEVYCRGTTTPEDVLQRLDRFDAAAFERGDFAAGMAQLSPDINLEITDVLESSIAPGSIRLFTSFAVLEHVSDIDAICRHMHRSLVPGGIGFHFIDLADHRSYRGDGAFGPLDFLTEHEGPANLNRLRAPEITAAHERAGFEILTDTRSQAKVDDELKARLVSPFKEMPFEDVSTTKQQLVVRKPRT